MEPFEILALTESEDLALLKSMAPDKTCEYQIRSGRELLCSAASTDDRTIVGTVGFEDLLQRHVRSACIAICPIRTTSARILPIPG